MRERENANRKSRGKKESEATSVFLRLHDHPVGSFADVVKVDVVRSDVELLAANDLFSTGCHL